MNHTRSEVASFLAAFRCPRTAAEVVLFPPLLYLEQVKAALWGDGVQLGAQNVYPGERGAFTGEVSAVQLRSVGVSHVLIGHSERRRLFGEESALLREKVLSALAAGLRVVYCVGETWRERSSGRTRPVIRGQLVEVLRGLELDGAAERLLVAYEPVWAIGTGRRPTPEAVALVHDQIRRELGRLFGAGGEGIRIVYGGSVTTESCAELARRVEVDGFLVGGASLEARSFMSLLGNALSARREAGGYP
jgi:triosephosphate isomerase